MAHEKLDRLEQLRGSLPRFTDAQVRYIVLALRMANGVLLNTIGPRESERRMQELMAGYDIGAWTAQDMADLEATLERLLEALAK